jgi:Tol biopolymer transport system component
METMSWQRFVGSVNATALIAALAAPAAGQLTERVSVDSAGAQATGSSDKTSISADGRYVAFESAASNLVSGDTNGLTDVFVHDRQSGATERMSVNSAGAQGNNVSLDPSISADGRYVAFWSRATNLVSGDTNGAWDVFVHDRQSGATERASVDSTGVQGNGDSGGQLPFHIVPSISADGRYVAFWSDASNLVSGDTNAARDVFVHDRQSGATERVSVDSVGVQGNGTSERPSISADGRYVAFQSAATNLVSGDTNGESDVFVHDRQSDATGLVSVDSVGAQGNGQSGAPSISADGRYVVFSSSATNLVSTDTNGESDIFVHDRQSGATELVSVDSPGVQGNSDSWEPWISANGRYVAFWSYATNLVSGDTNGFWDVFVHDRQSGVTERVSVDSGGAQGIGGGSEDHSISADGRYVAFQSSATNLVSGDTNGRPDIFVRDRGVAAPTVSSVSPDHGPNTGNTSVTIQGMGFEDAILVLFGLESVPFSVSSDSEIVADLAATSATGFVDVSVTSPAGTGTLADGFDYFMPPTSVGSPCGAPYLTWSGYPTLGETYTLTTQNLGSSRQVLLVDWSNIAPLSIMRWDCLVLIQPDSKVFLGTNPSYGLAIPDDPLLIGVHLRTQALVAGNPRNRTTQVLDVLIGE